MFGNLCHVKTECINILKLSTKFSGFHGRPIIQQRCQSEHNGDCNGIISTKAHQGVRSITIYKLNDFNEEIEILRVEKLSVEKLCEVSEKKSLSVLWRFTAHQINHWTQ